MARVASTVFSHVGVRPRTQVCFCASRLLSRVSSAAANTRSSVDISARAIEGASARHSIRPPAARVFMTPSSTASGMPPHEFAELQRGTPLERSEFGDGVTNFVQRIPVQLVDAAPAVDQDGLAGDEIAVVRGEEDERTDEVFRNLRTLEHAQSNVRLLALVRHVLLVLAAQGEARRDGVHADAELTELAGQRAGEPHDAALGRRVVDVVRHALEERAGGDVDDLALAARLHGRKDGARAEEEPAQVDRHDLVPFLDRNLHERAAHDRAVDCGVVHQHVDRAESREGLGGQAQRIALARDIALHAQRLRAPGLDLLDGGLGIDDVGHHDAGALRGDTQAVFASDASRAARDDDDLVLEAHRASYSWKVLTYTPGEPCACRMWGRMRCVSGAMSRCPAHAALSDTLGFWNS